MSKHNELGIKGEILALKYLEQKGFVILETNWRFEKSEVDLIARDKNTLVFAEVKTRSGNYFGFPENSVHEKKQEMLAKAAAAYSEQHQLNMDIRFDVVSITFHSGMPKIYYIRDAFFPYQL
jgi:putative endonuclease